MKTITTIAYTPPFRIESAREGHGRPVIVDADGDELCTCVNEEGAKLVLEALNSQSADREVKAPVFEFKGDFSLDTALCQLCGKTWAENHLHGGKCGMFFPFVQSRVSPWRPLSEAPKDATPLVICWVSRKPGRSKKNAGVLYWDVGRKEWVECDGSGHGKFFDDSEATFQPLESFAPTPQPEARRSSISKWLPLDDDAPKDGQWLLVRWTDLDFRLRLMVMIWNNGGWADCWGRIHYPGPGAMYRPLHPIMEGEE